MTTTHRVTILPENQDVFVLAGASVIEAAGQAGVIIHTPCSGRGTCGKCRVIVHGHAPSPTHAERLHLSEDELNRGVRLACGMKVAADMQLTIPDASRFYEQVILTDGRESSEHHHKPNVRRYGLTLDPPSGEDLRCDADRILDALPAEAGRGLRMDTAVLRQAPGLLRENAFNVTVALDGRELVNMEGGDALDRSWGVAFDIGTTTIAGVLVDLCTGQQHAVASRTNPQIRYGDDVVGRIQYAQEHEQGLQTLHECLVETLNDIIGELVASGGIDGRSIDELTAVGNTTMVHGLLNIDPASIGHAPYVAAFRDAVDLKASSVGIHVNPGVNLHVLPNLAGFVGSDTLAVAIASGIDRCDGVTLAIDIGTNGELLIGGRERLLSCSCAAGPAFEGARILQGMRAAEGAINKVVITDRIEVSVIGGTRARGLCGSGLLDAVAELLNAGLIDPTGRLCTRDAVGPDVPPDVAAAIVEHQGQPAVVLAGNAQEKGREPVILTQKDIRELQLAKAAIASGIRVITKLFGMEPGDLSSVLLAGGFGNFLRRSSAKRIGLLPDIPKQRIEFIGNAALVGARQALGCICCRDRARTLSRSIEYIELANRPDFQQYFMDAMMFSDHEPA